MRWPPTTFCASSSLPSSTGAGLICRSTQPWRTFPTHHQPDAANVPYTPWHLLEHLRIAQSDILDYIRNRAYLAPNWPEEYWPARDATATPEQFALTIQGFKADRAALHDLVPIRPPTCWRRSPTPRDTPSCARSSSSGPQRLPHRRVRDPPSGHGDMAARSVRVVFVASDRQSQTKHA